MSYPSIVTVLEERSIDAGASEEQLRDALLEAFRRDLPLGLEVLRKVADKAKQIARSRVLHIEDPNTPVGKQIIRLLGCDISRGIVERHFDVAFGFYNCCGVVVSTCRKCLQMSMQEQIDLQNGVLALADC
jgi:hypothetical protein